MGARWYAPLWLLRSPSIFSRIHFLESIRIGCLSNNYNRACRNHSFFAFFVSARSRSCLNSSQKSADLQCNEAKISLVRLSLLADHQISSFSICNKHHHDANEHAIACDLIASIQNKIPRLASDLKYCNKWFFDSRLSCLIATTELNCNHHHLIDSWDWLLRLISWIFVQLPTTQAYKSKKSFSVSFFKKKSRPAFIDLKYRDKFTFGCTRSAWFQKAY